MHFNANSLGKIAKGSNLHSAFNSSVKKLSCDGQHMDRSPRNVKVLAAPEEAEKSDQIVLAVCCSVAESVSRRCNIIFA